MSYPQGSVVADLERWFRERLHGRAQAIPYLLSPEWRKLMGDIYAEYDELERKRGKAEEPRLSWQAAVDRERRFADAQMAKPVAMLSDEEWAMAPLWVHLSRYLDRPDPDEERRLFGWASALADWTEIQSLYDQDEKFRSSLSNSQRLSYGLLDAWWTAAYCDKDLVDAAKGYMNDRIAVETKDDPQEQRASSGSKTLTDVSLYHSACFGLFLGELHPRSWFPHTPSSIKHVQMLRWLASSQCLMQRMAYRSLRPENKPFLSSRELEPGPFDWTTAPGGLRSADTSIKPYHLWDCEEKRTVTVQDFPSCPEYLCISHTWGRWRTRTDAMVPGVPWPVPENKQYDVTRLPEQLPTLGSRYIWLDLFCIPQDRGERAQLEIANQASIFRGAHQCIAWLHDVEGWAVVTDALKWMGLKYLQATNLRDHDLIASMLLDAAAGAASPAELMKREEGSDLSGSDLNGVEPCTWFSSLWTLQECALCPNLVFCSRTWELLRDVWGVPISIRSLMVFTNDCKLYLWNEKPTNVPFSDDLEYRRALLAQQTENWGSKRNDPSHPAGVKDLWDVQGITGLDNVLSTSSPMAVFINANRRKCSSNNRAPAIMSALGITDWYKRDLAAGVSPQVFVHDMFPLEFLREAAAKFGAIFYDSFARVPLRRRPVKPLLSTWFPSLCEGTMLPVAKDPGWANRVVMAPSQSTMAMEDHPSVSEWVINGSGSVTAMSAGIFMTSRDVASAENKVRATVDCATQMSAEYHPFYVALSDTFDDLLELLQHLTLWRRRIFAVALYKAGDTLHGILLEEFAWGLFGKTYLTKIGRFLVNRGEMPAVETVNWEIM